MFLDQGNVCVLYTFWRAGWRGCSYVGLGPEVIKLLSCSTQLSTKFQLLIQAKIPTNDI